MFPQLYSLQKNTHLLACPKNKQLRSTRAIKTYKYIYLKLQAWRGQFIQIILKCTTQRLYVNENPPQRVIGIHYLGPNAG